MHVLHGGTHTRAVNTGVHAQMRGGWFPPCDATSLWVPSGDWARTPLSAVNALIAGVPLPLHEPLGLRDLGPPEWPSGVTLWDARGEQDGPRPRGSHPVKYSSLSQAGSAEPGQASRGGGHLPVGRARWLSPRHTWSSLTGATALCS